MSDRAPLPIVAAVREAFVELNPLRAARRPVLFLVEAALLYFACDAGLAETSRDADVRLAAGALGAAVLIALIRALAEARPRAREEAWLAAGRGTRTRQAFLDGTVEETDAEHLRAADRVIVEAGEVIPADGTVLEGAALVDESAVTGESAPVLREPGGVRAAVIGGTRVLSDRLKIRVDAEPGRGALGLLGERLGRSLRPSGRRELALSALALLPALAYLGWAARGAGPGLAAALPPRLWAAAAAALLPTTLAALGGAIGPARVRRLLRRNLVARDERAAQAAGRVDAILIGAAGAAPADRRRAVELIAGAGVPPAVLGQAAQLTSLIDETPEGRSLMSLAKTKSLRERKLSEMKDVRFVPTAAHTRVSGIDVGENVYRKGPAESIRAFVGALPEELSSAVERIRRTGGDVVAIATIGRALGVAHMREPAGRELAGRLGRLREAGLRVVLVCSGAPPDVTELARDYGGAEAAAADGEEAKKNLVAAERAAGRRVAVGASAAAADLDVGRFVRGSLKFDAALCDLDGDPLKVVDAVEAGRAARRAQTAADAAAFVFDAAKALAVAIVLAPVFSAGASAAAGAGVEKAALAAGAAGLLALSALAAAVWTEAC